MNWLFGNQLVILQHKKKLKLFANYITVSDETYVWIVRVGLFFCNESDKSSDKDKSITL